MGTAQRPDKPGAKGERAEKLIVRGRKLLDNWDDESELDRAEKLFRDSVRLDPDNPEGWRGLGDVLLENASLDNALFAEALACYERARDLGTDTATLWRGFALAAIEVPSRSHDALGAIERARTFDPNNIDLLDDYAGILVRLASTGDQAGNDAGRRALIERSLQVARQREALTPEARPMHTADPILWQGALLLALDRAEDALAAFVRVEASDAAQQGILASLYKRQACYGRALALDHLGVPERALAALDEGLAHADGYDVLWHAFRARLLLKTNQPEAALSEAREALSDFDVLGYPWQVYADALVANGLREEAHVAQQEAANRPQRPLPIDDLLPMV